MSRNHMHSHNIKVIMIVYTFLALFTYFNVQIEAACPDEASDLLNWSDESTWSPGGVPLEGQVVNITKPTLLDTVTNSLGGVLVTGNGRLVFSSSVAKAKLITDHLLIENNGIVEIGSKSCEFDGDAEILLTGKRNPANDVGSWGQKFIGVDRDGSLEIFGKERVAWTLLDGNLEPKNKLFLSTTSGGQTSKQKGLVIYEFFPNGTLRGITDGLESKDDLQVALDNVAPDAFLVISKYREFSCTAFKNKRYFTEVIEQKFNISAGEVKLDEMTIPGDAYLFIIDLPTGKFNQSLDIFGGDGDTDGTKTAKLTMTLNNVVYNAQTFNNPNNEAGIKDEIFVDSYSTDYFDHVITVTDDVDWVAGESIVIASTDYDYNQAEKFTVTSVSGKTVEIYGEAKYQHWGAFNDGVDMRAEVGLLSRNVKVMGKMEKECYVTDINDCVSNNFDNFGGHTRAVEGYKAYTIKGAELKNMGQAGLLGKYPIHFHMALNSSRADGPGLIENNAIHDSFQRCVTIHTTHHVNVINNVAYNHVGHCYFLEDGAEKHTVFRNNLGLGTKKGSLTPSDREATTFWITAPDTTLVGNRAAGSHNSKGVGFWFLFPDIPVDPSTDFGVYGPKEAKYTPITEFRDNVAHSNGNIGLALFRRLSENHGIIGCSTYSPRIDPLQGKNSELAPVYFDGFHGYKNRNFNVKMRSTSTELINFHLADSLIGVEFVRNQLGGYQRIRNSTIIGESSNLGAGENIKPLNLKGKRTAEYSLRSFPDPGHPEKKVIGVKIRAEGPTHVDNVSFKNFQGNSYRKSSGIAWADSYPFHNSPVSSANALSFENTGLKISEWDETTGRGDSSIMIQDRDGSLSGNPDWVIVKENMYFTNGDTCQALDGSNLLACDAKYSRVYLSPTKDVANDTYISDGQGNIITFADSHNMRTSYTVSNGDLVVLNWNITMYKKFDIKMAGMEKDDEIIVGLCLPSGAKNVTDTTKLYSIESGTTLDEATSLSELTSTTSKNVFFDKTKSIVYRKFKETREKTETDLSDCIGGLKKLSACPMLRVTLTWSIDNGFITDLNDGKCDSR